MEAFPSDTNFLIFYSCSRILDSLLDTNIRFLKLKKHAQKCSKISSRIKQSPPFHESLQQLQREQQANLVRGKGKYYPQPRITQKMERDLKLTTREGTPSGRSSRPPVRYSSPGLAWRAPWQSLNQLSTSRVSHSGLGG